MLINTFIITMIIKNKIKEINAFALLYIPALLYDVLITKMIIDTINHLIRL